MKIIFRSGVHTIGGTIVEVIEGKDRLIFDFGTVFDPTSDVELKPNVTGVYDNVDEYNTSVLISHLHLDHTKAMNLINNEVNIYMTDESKMMYDILDSVNFQYFMGETRHITGLKANEIYQISGFDVTLIPVDHDVIGACAMLIQRYGVNLLYTGDLRIHGRDSAATFKMVEQMKNIKIDAMITEGVTISFIDEQLQIIPSTNVKMTEQDIEDKYIEIVKANSTFTFVNPYIMGSERLLSIVNAAAKNNRELLVTKEIQQVISKLFNQDFRVYEENMDLKGDEVIIFSFKDREKYDEIIANSTLIHCGGEPLGDFDPSYQVFLDYCQKNDIDLQLVAVGGHGEPANLAWIAKEINPEILFPIHSFKPEIFPYDENKKIVPIENEVYEFYAEEK